MILLLFVKNVMLLQNLRHLETDRNVLLVQMLQLNLIPRMDNVNAQLIMDTSLKQHRALSANLAQLALGKVQELFQSISAIHVSVRARFMTKIQNLSGNVYATKLKTI